MVVLPVTQEQVITWSITWQSHDTSNNYLLDHDKWCSVLKSVENIPKYQETKQATDNILSVRGIKRKHEQQQITTTTKRTTTNNSNSTLDMYWKPSIKQ